MPECPRCHQTVSSQAITCPECHLALKAHGHPGIPLYRADEATYLCDTCTYHDDDTCNFPQRPYAKECTLYQDRAQSYATLSSSKSYTNQTSGLSQLKTWIKRNAGWLALVGLVVVSLLLSL
ncbi:zinc ribbon domain-containing protein [Trichocoleus desertorum AS-A10]|uniref:zinc ribbon domain-containing protein n=1 Tax=Trichocoleus desertorum TaxID=1481672 RepID=UPI0032997EA2